jgi:hypothetical protein
VNTNNEKTTTSFLVIETYSISQTVFSESNFAVGYCVQDTSTPTPLWIKLPTTIYVLGGNPENFLAFFNFPVQETANIYQTYWIPLEVKGKENKQVAGEIASASFKSLGGIFFEEVELPALGGIGSVKFTGSFISQENVTKKIPAACLPE